MRREDAEPESTTAGRGARAIEGTPGRPFRFPSVVARGVALVTTAGAVACGAASPGDGATASHDGAISAVHMRKCGACHVPPEPQTRTREYIETALARHRKRVHLEPAEWSAMTDYLALPDAASGPDRR